MSTDLATATNHQIRLAARPVGLPKDSDWSFAEEPVTLPADGGVLVRSTHLSLDPAMRGWMNEGKSYIAPVGIGEVMRAGGIGVVVASQNPAFAVGDQVRVAANGRGEVEVKGRGQAEMSTVFRGVASLLHGAQQQVVDDIFGG